MGCPDCSGRAGARQRSPRLRGTPGESDLYFEYDFYIIETLETDRWLARVRHDLVKRLVWPARDRRDLGGVPTPGELVATLVDDEGAPTTATALWAGLKADGPSIAGPVARFEAALALALAAAAAGDLDGVLALEPAFDELARALARSLDVGTLDEGS